MSKLAAIFIVTLYIAGSSPLIVPNELPTLLSLIYSNIPTIRKGTDSRVGWGFRLGDRADFQVLVELGPQKFTQPLANQPDNGSPSKRNVPHNFGNVLYAQRQHEKTHISDTDGGKWLKEWSENVGGPLQFGGQDDGLPSGGLGIGEIDAKSVIPDDAVVNPEQLRLRKKPDAQEAPDFPEENETPTTFQSHKASTFTDALDDVDLEK